jgi:hypothetical protein
MPTGTIADAVKIIVIVVAACLLLMFVILAVILSIFFSGGSSSGCEASAPVTIPAGGTSGTTLQGKVSWFGGPGDSTSGPTTASGLPVTQPGIAVYTTETLGGYWVVRFPNGRTAVLQQTDFGPAPWTGRVLDVLYSALPAIGYNQLNFPTDSQIAARYLGKSQKWARIAIGHTSIPAVPDAPAIEAGGGCTLGSGGRDDGPGGLVTLPTKVTGGPTIQCDRRIRDDVILLALQYRIQVTACYAIHSKDGEHPLGAAVDVVPAPGATWEATTEKLARAAGWRPLCAAVGVAPSCARSPFRFIGYNGYPGHGDPANCYCGDNAHLHLSWMTSASPGQPQNAFRDTYFAPDWIDVLAKGGSQGSDEPGSGSEKTKLAPSEP